MSDENTPDVDPAGIMSMTEHDLAVAKDKIKPKDTEGQSTMDYLKVIQAFSDGYKEMCEEIIRQAFGCTSISIENTTEPTPLTLKSLEDTLKLIPRRPMLELTLVTSVEKLTEDELEIAVRVMQAYAKYVVAGREGDVGSLGRVR
jgi:hypothetical protein